MHGKGKFSWPDGREYEGEYFNDLKHGYGVFKWYFFFVYCSRADGRLYKGPWINGNQDGEGLFIDKKGNEKPGIWKDGNLKKFL